MLHLLIVVFVYSLRCQMLTVSQDAAQSLCTVNPVLLQVPIQGIGSVPNTSNISTHTNERIDSVIYRGLKIFVPFGGSLSSALSKC